MRIRLRQYPPHEHCRISAVGVGLAVIGLAGAFLWLGLIPGIQSSPSTGSFRSGSAGRSAYKPSVILTMWTNEAG